MELVSAVVIARNEAAELRHLLPALCAEPGVEIIVVDGQSSDGSAALARECGCRTLVTAPGRARQLNAGAGLARGEALVFIHADCRLLPGWAAAVRRVLVDTDVAGGAFSLQMRGGRPMLDRFLSWSGRWNARRTGIYPGDHTLFVRRAAFERVGRFPPVELMEDLLLCRRLAAQGRLVQLSSPSIASARRFVQRGYLRTVLQMRLLRALARWGASSRRLEQWYLGLPGGDGRNRG